MECFADAHCDDGALLGARICDDGGCRAGCRDDGDCPGGQLCDDDVAACRGCQADGDCAGPLDRCIDEVCQPGCVVDRHCPANIPNCDDDGLCVECTGRADCGGGLCDDQRSACIGCEGNADDVCPGGSFCDWASDACFPLPNQGGPVCSRCRFNAHCGGRGDLCIWRQDGTERFCGSTCNPVGADACDPGYVCRRIGNAGFNCVPEGISDWGATCAAIRDLGLPCEQHADCGVGLEGLCRAGVCSIPCDAEAFRPLECPGGFICAPGFDASPTSQSCLPGE